MKLMKKLLCVALMAALMLAVAVPALANTNAPESVTIYKSSKDNSHVMLGNIPIWDIDPDTKITKPKSSKTSILVIEGINRWSSATTWYDDSEGDMNADANIYVNPIKAGRANVSFKVAGVAQKVAVTVKAYANPIKSFVITGISSNNLRAKFAKSSWVTDEMTKNAKKGSIKISAATGWKITGIDWRNEATGLDYSYWMSTPKTSVNLSIPAMKTTENYEITVNFENTTNGGSMFVGYYLFNVAGE